MNLFYLQRPLLPDFDPKISCQKVLSGFPFLPMSQTPERQILILNVRLLLTTANGLHTRIELR